MKALISGITGFVGSHLADYLLKTQPDTEIYAIKRWRSPLDNITHILDKITLIDCDLRDLSFVLAVIKRVQPDIIYHLASQSYVLYSFHAPADTIQTNVLGTLNLLEALRLSSLNPLFLLCSSSEVYGQVSNSDLPIDEEQPFNPMSPYAVSKVACDMLGWQYYASYGMKIVRTRAFTHTGPRRGEVFAESSFAKQIALIEKGKQTPKIRVGNLKSVRTYCDVRDMVRAYSLITDKMIGKVYNIGGHETMMVGEVLERLIKLSSLSNRVYLSEDENRMRPSDVTLQIPDVTRFTHATGWKPEIHINTTLLDLLDYWRERV